MCLVFFFLVRRPKANDSQGRRSLRLLSKFVSKKKIATIIYIYRGDGAHDYSYWSSWRLTRDSYWIFTQFVCACWVCVCFVFFFALILLFYFLPVSSLGLVLADRWAVQSICDNFRIHSSGGNHDRHGGPAGICWENPRRDHRGGPTENRPSSSCTIR